MKTNVNLANVRSEFKAINGRSVNNVLSVIYALIAENKEENRATISLLNKILPSSKKKAKDYINDIILFGHVGETRTIKRKDGKEYTYDILPSVDMVLRFFVAKYNNAIPESGK